MSKKYISYDEALAKMQYFCAYQERCHQEVRQKLYDLGIYGEEIDEIIVDLIEDDFLNELRFAEQYAGGKFRIKKWGKHKIIRKLKSKAISKYSINKALENEIEEEDYYKTLERLITKKNKWLKEKNPYKRKQKLVRYAINKGYESSLAWEIVNALLDKK